MKSKVRRIEKRWGKPLPQILQDLSEQGMTQRKIARRLGVSQGTVSLWLVRYGLHRKTILVPRDAS